MSLTATAKGGASIAPLEAGTYSAICYGLIDIGVQYNETFKNSAQKVIIMWEIPDEKITIDGEEKSRVMSQTYTVSLNERAALRRDLTLWRGKDFTDEELAGFDLKTIVGVPCLLTVVHREYQGRTYANIGSIAKLAKGMQKPKGTLEPVIFDLESDPLEMIESFPEWIQERIKKSETYTDRINGTGNRAGDESISVDSDFIAELDDEDGLPF